ncbi:MAG: hypothetical protein JWL85_462, partial [Candidatus Saccharibacteria bacterium]|nr:hypothetical protein [Candidatus Saccharibacteria bacterium]
NNYEVTSASSWTLQLTKYHECCIFRFMSSGPRFTISKNAYRHIKEASLDTDYLADYLDKRRIPEEEIAKLEITIDDAYMFFGADGIYLARDINDQASKHIIGLSPSRMPKSIEKRGKNLRHETEHFVYEIHHPNHWRNRKILMAGATAISGCAGVVLGLQVGMDASRNLPIAAAIPIDGLAAIAAMGMCSLAAFMSAGISHIAFGPSEIQAQWAEHRRKSELPDDILQIEFA